MNLRSLLFSFHGRNNRLTFWVITVTLIGLGTTIQQLAEPYNQENPMTIGPAIVTLVSFFIGLWIGLAAQIKRWHDRNKSGWWALLNFIPVIGHIWILIECGFLPETKTDNRFGQKPGSLL